MARELATLFDTRGKPQTVVSDKGTEFTSKAILNFVDDRKFYSRLMHEPIRTAAIWNGTMLHDARMAGLVKLHRSATG